MITAGTGSIQPPILHNTEKWENVYGDRNDEDASNSNWIIILIISLIIIVVLAVIIVLVVIAKKRQSGDDHENDEKQEIENEMKFSSSDSIYGEREVNLTKEDKIVELSEEEKQAEYNKLYGN
jgi:flagellar basal body-associated protein FliL